VEFAITVALFLTTILAVADFGALGLVHVTMQHAVKEGARYAITGRTDLDPDSEGDRYRAVVQMIKRNSMGFYDALTPVIHVYRVTAGGTEDIGESFGNPGDIIVIKMNCTWHLLTPMIRPFFEDGEYRFTVSASMRNELYPAE
jgi:Flp pilus assembly protein TadG